jgi:preprotein translocase subunit SecG
VISLFAVFQLSQYIFGPLLFILSTFIILLILLQRGRGGGLTGALGGAGGSSAFGVKAGDILTRITAFSVLGWIVLCAFVCWFYLPAQLEIETTTFGAGALSIESDDKKPQTIDLPKASEPSTPAAVTPAPTTPAPSTPEISEKPATSEKPGSETPAPSSETPSSETPSATTPPATTPAPVEPPAASESK